MTDTKQISRRAMLRTSAGALLAGAASINPGQAQQPYTPHSASRIGQPQEGPDTPKLTMYMEDLLDKAEARRLKQIGITWVDTQAVPEQPWGMDYLQPRVDALKSEGMHIAIMMVRWSFNGGMDPNMSQIVYAGPDRDKEIAKIKQTIVNCGRLGIPVVEYNFYNHRAT
ncbi:MAG: mannonate dehydratase, partial [Steroidobacteraceae bacterium]